MIVQPSVAKRLTFARYARMNGLRRHSHVTWIVGDLEGLPADLLEGAQVDGKPYADANSRRRKVKRGGEEQTLTEPSPPQTDEAPEFAPPEADDDQEDLDYDELFDKTKPELVELAEARGLDVSGTKADIIERLVDAGTSPHDEEVP